MPSGDYTAVTGGALKLKGANVQKKKKKRKDKSDLEKNMSTGGDASVPEKYDSLATHEQTDKSDHGGHQSDDDVTAPRKTESERKYDEIRKKRLQQMAESSSSRPELLKTHKERVEELNTYLSKLSEHHDMPKIGPG
ncbi:hypothetical protein NOR_06014 [Metarhizium rileyi]|uniref:DUF1754-domain-containing protein n=1 Tax=Metarhizium rileyi (strain RCEF 4871) TaxID=1649241 RepID=A0A167BGJ1_METRR|nr:hypothetical protein NOR_06014 [Metarhizium rileyi RCEF 4871]TWU70569.1 hypothetical protein ED733_001060 [Metarhizium rileyi]